MIRVDAAPVCTTGCELVVCDVYRIALVGVYLFIATFIIVDLFLVSHSAYNLVSLIGMFVYLTIMFVFSHSPAKVSTIHTVHGNDMFRECLQSLLLKNL